jgi:hypothetical protein
MALANKQSESLYDKTGSGKKKMTSSKQTQISASYAGNALTEEPGSPDSVEALVYMVQEMQEDIDELRRYVTNEATGSAITTIKFVNAADLPTSNKGLASGLLYVDAKDSNRLKKA